MKYTEKNIKTFKTISLVAGIFTVVVAITMIFSLLQLKIMNPLDNPAIAMVTEQFDRDPDNMDKAEQVRALDLMARKAYFSSRWQVETGSYLMLFGALVFVIFQRLIAGAEKQPRTLRPDKPDINAERTKYGKYLIVSAASVTAIAIISSFVLRNDLPAPGRKRSVSRAESKVAAVSIQLSDVNYPAFRGQGNNGIAGGSGYPTEWNGNTGLNIKWKIANPQPGQSSPVIWGNKLFVTGAGDGEIAVWCIDKNTGEILWKGSGQDFAGASMEEPESDEDAGMAVPSPAVDNEVVCASFGNGNVVCYDHDGNFLWGINLGVPESSYGYSGSLLIYEKILIVQYDSRNKIAILGIDITTGDIKWETARTGRPVNSSPALAIFDGVAEVVINGNPNVSAYDPLTGRELWSVPGVSGDVAGSPAINSTTAYVSSDYYKLLALRRGRNVTTAWENNTYTPGVPSPVANDNYVFLALDHGDVVCYNAQTGELLWDEILNYPYYASPIICDGKVWMLDRYGIMHIIEASDKFNIIAVNELGEPTDATPAFSEQKIYIRGRQNIYCIAID